ncbi:hypothetical protein ACFXB3_27680 [Streptomyces sp. NPDC059447]|uniref:hypothetical protein n=1 Tax=Streptomyces sp. NPDC059447 TaxID=3346834 RepID=UPI00369E9D7A
MTNHDERPMSDHRWHITPCPCRLGEEETTIGPSRNLLERALLGWERFSSSFNEPSDA